MAINVENIKKWIEALRSGDYTQGRMALEKTNGTNCCLGVVCRVAQNNGVNLTVSTHSDGYISFDGNTSSLPESVYEWLGFEDESGTNPYISDTKDCIGANDNLNYNFSQIADALEAKYVKA